MDWGNSSTLYQYVNKTPYGNYVTYIGQMDLERNLRHGMGIRVNASGQYEIGYWYKDHMIGPGFNTFQKGSYFYGHYFDNIKVVGIANLELSSISKDLLNFPYSISIANLQISFTFSTDMENIQITMVKNTWATIEKIKGMYYSVLF